MMDDTAPKAKPISLRLDQDTLDQIDAALPDGSDRTTFIREAIGSALNPVTVTLEQTDGPYGHGEQITALSGQGVAVAGRPVPTLARSTQDRLRPRREA